jgi:hypothetical protein
MALEEFYALTEWQQAKYIVYEQIRQIEQFEENVNIQI